jgi:murein L,D-transpeptidase YcbB/YkuD
MKPRTGLIMAYAAAAVTCVCFVVVLVRPWAPLPVQPRKPSANVAQAVQNQLAQADRKDAGLVRLYQARGYTTLWFNGDDLSADAHQVMTTLAGAGQDALPADHYRVPAPPTGQASDADRALFDLRLTAAALRYAADLRWGAWRPEQLFNDVSMPREHDDIEAGLVQAADRGKASDYLRGLAPPVREYAQLRAGLARYRGLGAGDEWPTVMAETRPSAQNLARLKARLQLDGYLAPDPQGARPAAITVALKAFQTDNAITGDGKLNARTVAMLNVPPAARARQIAVNMERMRWMPHDTGSQYILVNVPDASLVLMESGRPVLVSRVVVGAPDKPTPILATKAVSITINPAWHVPKSIVAREIQPKLDQDPDYLETKHMEMKNGDVVQLPGPDNALGSVKFEMPNGFDVYLHDTPSKHAFLSDDRALSHGCVRVQQIRPLAEHLLGLSDEELGQLIGTDETDSRHLKQPVPVFIQYWTAIPREDGRIVFREDVYGRDARMIGRMFPGEPTKLASAGPDQPGR